MVLESPRNQSRQRWASLCAACGSPRPCGIGTADTGVGRSADLCGGMLLPAVTGEGGQPPGNGL